MRTSSHANIIQITEDKLFWADQEIDLSQEISQILEDLWPATFHSEQFMPNFPECQKHISKEHEGISLYSENGQTEKLSIAMYIPNTERCFKGDIILDGKKLPSPLLSVDAEKIIPNLVLDRPRSIYDDTFTPHYSNSIVINGFDVTFMTSRDGRFIGVISIALDTGD